MFVGQSNGQSIEDLVHEEKKHETKTAPIRKPTLGTSMPSPMTDIDVTTRARRMSRRWRKKKCVEANRPAGSFAAPKPKMNASEKHACGVTGHDQGTSW